MHAISNAAVDASIINLLRAGHVEQGQHSFFDLQQLLAMKAYDS